MKYRVKKWWLCSVFIFIFSPLFAQVEGCPANINFSTSYLNNWFAYTGKFNSSTDNKSNKTLYDSTKATPIGTIGANTIYEYSLPNIPTIHVNTVPIGDAFGNFASVPVINGYSYNYSVLLGSTAITTLQDPQGGYLRGISYKISVPIGLPTKPYTLTYAYAMVLQNGRHNSNEQPLFSAKLIAPNGIIACASPSYFLPTLNNATTNGGADATLDTIAAKKNGFSLSSTPTPNQTQNPNETSFNVWTKDWTEVTIDLSPYRGQQVTLNFEVDNCVPGGHFAYAYVALRNQCNGLIISGDTTVCSDTKHMYSIPALANATYQWTIPSSFTIVSGGATNIIYLNSGNQNDVAFLKVNEQNSCANLNDSIKITTIARGTGGDITGSTTVCTQTNSSTLLLENSEGNILNWLSSPDGINWTNIADNTPNFIAQNLIGTTLYKAVVQTSTACVADTSTAALIKVDEKSIGGKINPAVTNFCLNQNRNNILTLNNNLGSVVDWQFSTDNINWLNSTPIDNSIVYTINGINSTTQYRTIVKNGVCPADTSAKATVTFFATKYPLTSVDFLDTTICYNKSVQLHEIIIVGTNYSWTNANLLNNHGDGNVPSTPYTINASTSQTTSTSYILSVENAGCPNILKDTFNINVIPKFTVSAGNDTTVVINQPLLFNTLSTDILKDKYFWSPSTNLDDATLQNPTAIFQKGTTAATYIVQAIDSIGCFAYDTINVKIYALAAGIYVPTAFTPNGDGLNDIFKPINLGLEKFNTFKIYNRWGQLLYSTSDMEKGWDGTLNGQPQPSGTYVWLAEGIDYKGIVVHQKGYVSLIR